MATTLLNIRITPEERDALHDRAAQLGYRNLSDFIRARILQDGLSPETVTRLDSYGDLVGSASALVLIERIVEDFFARYRAREEVLGESPQVGLFTSGTDAESFFQKRYQAHLEEAIRSELDRLENLESQCGVDVLSESDRKMLFDHCRGVEFRTALKEARLEAVERGIIPGHHVIRGSHLQRLFVLWYRGDVTDEELQRTVATIADHGFARVQ